MNLTFNNKFGGTLCLATGVDRKNFIFTTVLRPDSENVQGAHAKGVGHVVVVVGVDADVVQEPGYIGGGTSSHSASHKELVTVGWCVDF